MVPTGSVKYATRDIPFERLEAVPYTTLCIDHATEQEVPNDPPVEEDILTMANPNSFGLEQPGMAKTASRKSQNPEHQKPLPISSGIVTTIIRYMTRDHGRRNRRI